MKPRIFVHLWIPNDLRGLYWFWYVDHMMEAIVNSGLQSQSIVSIHITMPMYWEKDARGEPFRINNGTREDHILFCEKVREYIEFFYPFVDINFTDIGAENLWEGTTLIPLWEYCKSNKDVKVLYLQSKGMLATTPNSKLWVKALLQNLVYRWRYCLSLLDDNDVVGLNDNCLRPDNYGPYVSGNMFWANSNYISTLEKPYYTDDRYKYEKWVVSGMPKYHFVFDTKVDHYLQYYA